MNIYNEKIYNSEFGKHEMVFGTDYKHVFLSSYIFKRYYDDNVDSFSCYLNNKKYYDKITLSVVDLDFVKKIMIVKLTSKNYGVNYYSCDYILELFSSSSSVYNFKFKLLEDLNKNDKNRFALFLHNEKTMKYSDFLLNTKRSGTEFLINKEKYKLVEYSIENSTIIKILDIRKSKILDVNQFDLDDLVEIL